MRTMQLLPGISAVTCEVRFAVIRLKPFDRKTGPVYYYILIF